ncbi:hypothetical protein [Roseospira goensis]|uniref:Uncharacterized protein n=1 Tax=Roseospira goensis TaxID=391922 RepID=A0A7W6RX83_9PROT|nr:hypothetical protein [Roseospira goensis]MBB4284842.1 hypothetical protein [Roseospira goensis]
MIYALLAIFVVCWLFVLFRFYQAAEYFSERSLDRALKARQQQDQ